MTQYFGLLLVVFAGVMTSVTANVNCYSCSYTITAAPWLHYECANDTDHVKTGSPTVPCPETFQCVTKVVYNQDLTEIRSISRGCFLPDSFKCGENCCDQSLYDVSCQYQCRSDNCNNRDVTAILKQPSGTGTAASTTPSVSMPCILMLCYFVVMRMFAGVK